MSKIKSSFDGKKKEPLCDIVCQHQAGQFSGFPTCVATVKANIITRGPTVYLKNDYT